MEVPLLGKTYAYDLLEVLVRGKLTFTGLLNEMKVSRTTLSNTLQALVDKGYVSKEVIGRYTVYRLTEKGLETLKPHSKIEDALLEHLTDYVLKRLREKGLLERYEIDRNELSEDISKRAQKHLKEIVESIETSIKEGE